jgi:hypothetical protein
LPSKIIVFSIGVESTWNVFEAMMEKGQDQIPEYFYPNPNLNNNPNPNLNLSPKLKVRVRVISLVPSPSLPQKHSITGVTSFDVYVSDVKGRRFEKVKNYHIFENWTSI